MLGRLTAIPNTQRKFGSGLAYGHLRVRMPNGSKVDLLVTGDELDRMFTRATCNPEDVPVPLGNRIRAWLDKVLSPQPPSKP